MQINDLTITAPLILGGRYSEAEVFGASVWLWMHSPMHRNAVLHALPTVLMPAIKNQQFVLVSRQLQPVFYFSWAWMDLEAEYRNLTQNAITIREQDWISGDRMWTLDCIAPFGDITTVWPLVKNQVLADHFSRYRYHRGEERGSRVKSWRGANVSAEQATLWYQQHPLATAQPNDRPINQQSSKEISAQAVNAIIQGTI